MVAVFAGVDLAASTKRPSGVAIIGATKERRFQLIFIGLLYSDDEIIDVITKHGAQIVAIDSPLTRPLNGGHYRAVDLAAKKMGYRVLPLTWRGMDKLVSRGITLANKLVSAGVKVIETHPLSALRSSGCSDVKWLCSKLGIDTSSYSLSKDEESGLIAAIVAGFYYFGASTVIKERDGEIYLLPRIC
jgi:predicted nuclease with RNAse H fold